MIRKSTIAALAIMATVGAASPAFALVANSPALAGGGSIGYNSTNVLTGTAASTYGLNSPKTNAIAGGSICMPSRWCRERMSVAESMLSTWCRECGSSPTAP